MGIWNLAVRSSKSYSSETARFFRRYTMHRRVFAVA